MKKKVISTLLSLSTFCAVLFLSFGAQAQGAKPVASPKDSVSAKVGKAAIEIKYSSPSVKGRKIWGELVPYNAVWRAGANGATTFSTDKDILVEGKSLAAGTYSFFLIPAETGAWTAIFNKEAKQWGAYKYKESEDALRVSVKPAKASKLAERLNYKISSKGFTLNWENLVVPVSIK